MHKKLFLSLIVATTINATQTYTMYAEHVQSMGDVVYADGSVTIYTQGKIYKSNSATYNKKTKTLKLVGDVVTVVGGSVLKNEKVELKLDKKSASSDKFFIYDGSEGLWLRGAKFSSNKKIIVVKDSEVSSCNIANPDWKITFKKAKLNKEKEFLTISKPLFYFKGTPVFGLPWFAFPTVRERKSGLLRPTFGAKAESGFVFMQPYFYAPSKSWDITVTPQIRTKRGLGIYSELNFVDTPNSKGKITFGEFFDKSSFYHDKNLKNSSHYGLDISYQSDEVFKSLLKQKSSKDGLWVDLHTLNDIDYENLKDINIKSLNKLVTSRFNYFLKRDRDYFGVYAKYFIDTDKQNNADTMQELPTLQYHRFTTKLPIKNLIYSIDYKVTNNYRRKGLDAVWHEINLPIKFDFPLASDYLNLSISENIYYSKIKYSNRDALDIDDATYKSNYHRLVLSSDLTKQYDSFVHNLQLESSLQIPSFEQKSGDFAEFVNINKEEKNLKLKANQYFYDLKGYNFLSIRSSQIVFLKRDDENKYGDLLNEIKYNYSKNLSFLENINYSNRYDKVSKVQSIINYHDDIYNLYISHTYENTPDRDKVNYLTSRFDMKLDGGYKFETSIDYDIEKDIRRDWSVGLFRDKKCWNYEIKYKESVTPMFTSSGARSYKNRGLYFLVNFANIGGISYEYSKDSISDEVQEVER